MTQEQSPATYGRLTPEMEKKQAAFLIERLNLLQLYTPQDQNTLGETLEFLKRFAASETPRTSAAALTMLALDRMIDSVAQDISEEDPGNHATIGMLRGEDKGLRSARTYLAAAIENAAPQGSPGSISGEATSRIADLPAVAAFPSAIEHNLRGEHAAKWLSERIEWLKNEYEHGGDFEHLNTRRQEAIHIAEKLGIKWEKK